MEGEVSTSSSHNVSMEEDMRKMLFDKSFSDMVFLCGEQGEEVPALRMLVAARSPVLETMLIRSSMTEIKLSCVLLREIEVSTMRICMEFFYTDIVQTNSWLNWETAMKVVAAAKFFLVPRLEQLAISHLSSISYPFAGNVDLDSPLITDITKSYTHGVMLHHAHPNIELGKLLKNLACHIDVCWNWSLECHMHLSELALGHLLQNLQLRVQGSLKEYFRFHLVIRWCLSRLVLQSDEPVAELKLVGDTMNRFLPWSEEGCTLTKLTEASNNRMIVDASYDRVLIHLREQLARCLENLSINLSKIPSAILCKNIEPLMIVPSALLLTAYRSQAMSRLHLRWDESSMSKNYSIDKSDTTILNWSDAFQGLARCSTGVDICSIMSFQWEVLIVEPCRQLRVGFCTIRPFTSELKKEHLLGECKESWALSSEGILYHNFMSVAARNFFCDAFPVQKGLRNGVHLDMKNCTFSINGKKKDSALLPCWPIEKTLYPAISLQKLGRAVIQMPDEDWSQ